MATMTLAGNSETQTVRPFQHEPDYLALSRMLLRYQNLILFTPIPNEKIAANLKAWQPKVQAELWSPSSIHRTKWLRNIEHARTLLLRLEKTAQTIKTQRTKKEVVRDLAQKRAIIKQLRVRVEEIGREVELRPDTARRPTSGGEGQETLYDVYQQIERERRQKEVASSTTETTVPPQATARTRSPEKESEGRETLFGNEVRRRHGKDQETAQPSRGVSSGYAGTGDTERQLQAKATDHEKMSTELFNMAILLKQQANKMQFSLQQDNDVLSQVGKGLELSGDAMEAARKGMASLTRMSEEQGFIGRMKLYAIICGLWGVLFILVFAGPKLRF